MGKLGGLRYQTIVKRLREFGIVGHRPTYGTKQTGGIIIGYRGRNSRLNPAAPPSGRVKEWRHGIGQVSIPCRIKRSMRISRTALSWWLGTKAYGTYRTGRAFGAQ